jgi:hypothetical protein
METEAIHAAVGIHPSFLSIAVGEKIKNPFACLPAQVGEGYLARAGQDGR